MASEISWRTDKLPGQIRLSSSWNFLLKKHQARPAVQLIDGAEADLPCVGSHHFGCASIGQEAARRRRHACCHGHGDGHGELLYGELKAGPAFQLGPVPDPVPDPEAEELLHEVRHGCTEDTVHAVASYGGHGERVRLLEEDDLIDRSEESSVGAGHLRVPYTTADSTTAHPAVFELDYDTLRDGEPVLRSCCPTRRYQVFHSLSCRGAHEDA